jgi:ATP-dependent phosphoenolpyruvate carboxykinase
MKKRLNHICSFLILLLFTAHAQAQSPQSSYVVKSGDQLKKISNTAYGTPHLYKRIIKVTNEKAEKDTSLQKIIHRNRLEVGQKIYIPLPVPAKNLVDPPKTNCEIRMWYNYQVVAIKKINEKWIKDGLKLEERAKKAYEMRHQARLNARFMMQYEDEVKKLHDYDRKNYGNPDGPTFKWLMAANTGKKGDTLKIDGLSGKRLIGKGMSDEESWQNIIDSSYRTDTRYNSECQ